LTWDDHGRVGIESERVNETPLREVRRQYAARVGFGRANFDASVIFETMKVEDYFKSTRDWMNIGERESAGAWVKH
jgi:hypothetical protein